MRQTENYEFNILEENEFYDAELENENWRKLDAALKEISDKLCSKDNWIIQSA